MERARKKTTEVLYLNYFLALAFEVEAVVGGATKPEDSDHITTIKATVINLCTLEVTLTNVTAPKARTR